VYNAIDLTKFDKGYQNLEPTADNTPLMIDVILRYVRSQKDKGVLVGNIDKDSATLGVSNEDLNYVSRMGLILSIPTGYYASKERELKSDFIKFVIRRGEFPTDGKFNIITDSLQPMMDGELFGKIHHTVFNPEFESEENKLEFPVFPIKVDEENVRKLASKIRLLKDYEDHSRKLVIETDINEAQTDLLSVCVDIGLNNDINQLQLTSDERELMLTCKTVTEILMLGSRLGAQHNVLSVMASFFVLLPEDRYKEFALKYNSLADGIIMFLSLKRNIEKRMMEV
jgi:hypothetical protein